VPDTDVTNICPKNKIPIKSPTEIVDWRTDPDYRRLRDTMLAGKKLPLYCHDCYDKEKRGVESARQFETLEWAVRMDFAGPEDFNCVTDPVFYEIRPSNKCNIMCRMCDDARSHLIEKEKIELNLPLLPYRFKDLPFDQIKFETLERIYVGGGEPTIMPEFYEFLQKCIDVGRTDFELCIGTNGMKFSNKLLNLLEKFSNVLLSFSFDGYGKVNDYIRWRSNFDTIVKNSRLLRSQGHKIGLQTVPSIYNVTRLHEIFEFYDEEFPGSTCLVQAAEGHNGFLLPWHHPRADQVVESMEKCMKTNQYLMSGRSLKSYVDTLHNLYSKSDYEYDKARLRGFFNLNDLWDQSRGSRLGDYVPELENCRELIK
jgi:pyruvate-formate lyase-activating enzyme